MVGCIRSIPGDSFLNGRYIVRSVAGKGTFGTVFYCFDRKRGCTVALKAVRSVDRYLDAAEVEIDILRTIYRKDPSSKSLCVQLLKYFTDKVDGKEHVFLVFEKLDRSLYEFCKANDYRGFPMEHVKSFAKQLLTSLQFCHSIKLIHTDLKTENVLLLDDAYDLDKDGERILRNTEIRLIDFGGATFDNEHHSSMINTRQYRSPEVILGLPWSYPSDMWSLGCILAELFTGELLFSTHDDLEHLALIQKIVGTPLPESLAHAALRPFRHSSTSSPRNNKRGGRSSSVARPDEIISNSLRLRWPEYCDSKSSREHVESQLPLTKLLGKHKEFLDLLEGLLEWDPRHRLTAEQALRLPLFKNT